MKGRIAAEAIGTAFLLAIVVGSGIMGEKLAAGNAAVALLANSVATGAGLFTLINVFAPVSGAHFNPAVTMLATLQRRMRIAEGCAYVAAQVGGAVIGVVAAHAMFGLPLLQASARARGTPGEALGEVLATFGLLLTIGVLRRAPVAQVAACVALWITSAYWFTSSTSFANPAVTFARSLTDTFAGIARGDVPGFIAAQLVAVGAAFFMLRWLCTVIEDAPAREHAAD